MTATHRNIPPCAGPPRSALFAPSLAGSALLRLLSVLALAPTITACFDPLPTPIIGCSSGIECPSGFCIQGLCQPMQIDPDITNDGVALEDSEGETSDASADGSDAADPVCKKDEECLAYFSKLTTCQAAICMAGSCQVIALPKGTSCTSGTLCPVKGSCVGITCVTGSAIPCDDDNACTFDACGLEGCTHQTEPDGTACEEDGLSCTDNDCAAGHCVARVRANTCLIGGYCFLKDEPKPGAPCQRCVPIGLAAQVSWTEIKGESCDDGDPCTMEDTCDAAAHCLGTPTDCLDDNPCTTDACEPALGCVHLPNSATCEDDDLCSLSGQCADGKCGPGVPISCDDGNPCTVDSCVQKIGCVHLPYDGSCVADTDPCTKDICLAGACVATPALDICKMDNTCVQAGAKADGNPCLICNPIANPGGWTVLVGGACDDGNLCTTADVCFEGKCIGQKASCADNNPCTSDDCAPTKGCIFSPIEGPCTDNDACTKGDKCVSGACLGTPMGPEACADGNPCTDDVCSPAVGCTNPPNSAPCDDEDPCTKGDLCNSAKCVSGEMVCPCESDADCEDSNPCTLDACVQGQGCVNQKLGANAKCNDEDACTLSDHCVAGLCQGVTLNCDDGNSCTQNGCVAETGCTSLQLQGIGCADDNACTNNDLCVDGVCKGTPKSCDDGNPCSSDLCEPKTGSCGHVDAPPGSPCTEDGVSCTIDQCVGGQCNHGAVQPEFCLIGNYCYSGGAPHPAKQCLGCQPLKSNKGWSVLTGNGCFDYNACTWDTTCDPQGACLGKPVSCDDLNPCTKDACNPLASEGNGCVHMADDGGPCDDGDACTSKDTCAEGSCKGVPVSCDDANPCTIDTCDSTTGCLSLAAALGLPCPDDGLSCTIDACAEKSCVHTPKASWCMIADQCVPEGTKPGGFPCLSCVSKVHLDSWTFVSGDKCDDGDPCTIGDVCVGGACKGESDLACDDDNACTVDSCDPKTGCAHLDKSGSCDDGDACTQNDTCDKGKCKPGAKVKCPGGVDKQCAMEICEPALGCVKRSTCAPLHRCVQGLCLSGLPQKAPGPVTLPLGGLTAKQPLRPTLAWQESHTGEMGAVPLLWLAAQTSGCAPSMGLYSGVFTAAFQPGETQPAIQLLSTPGPSGGASWCALQPTFHPHPTSFNALVLGWIEGGHALSACAIASTGGQSRLGLVGLNGASISLAQAGPCPSGVPSAPLPTRPDLTLVDGGTGPALNAAALSGLLFRGSPAGPLWFGGNNVVDWGSKFGKLLGPLSEPGMSELPSSMRPVIVSLPSGSLLLSVSQLKPSTGWEEPVLTGQRFGDKGQPVKARTIVTRGVELKSNAPIYRAVEAAYDPDAKKIGLLISGEDVFAGQTRSFLAFARVSPDQAPLLNPKLAIYLSWPAGIKSDTTIRAFRIAELPNSEDFLVIWAAPGSAMLKALRIVPDKSGKDFATKEIAALTNNFAGQKLGKTLDSSGGLSEIAIDPQATRFAIAWEGVATVDLLTTPLPKP